MDIRYFKKYISIKTKKHWFLIGNVYGKGFTIVNWNKQWIQIMNRKINTFPAGCHSWPGFLFHQYA